jgi:predicted secreted protein
VNDDPIAQSDPIVEEPEAPQPVRRSRGRVIATVVAAVVLVAGVLVFVTTRGSGTALALSYAPGQQMTWKMSLDENLTMTVGSQTIPIKASMTGDATWRVTSVDSDGTATIQQSFSNAQVTANGQTLTTDLPTTTFRLTSDGRMLSSNGQTIFSGAPGQQFMGGAGQVSAILPSGSVQPGDSWSKHQSLTILGTPISFDEHATYVKDDEVSGTKAAVVRTTDTVPMHVTIDLSQVASTLGLTAAQVPAGAKVQYDLSVAGVTTSWVDVGAKHLLKTTGTAAVDGTFRIIDFPGVPDTPFAMKGTVALSMQPH